MSSTEPKRLTFRNRMIVPPGGYRYVDPEDNFEHVASSLDALVEMATRHRRANKIDVPDDFAAIVEDWICQKIPMTMTSAYQKARKVAEFSLTTQTIQGVTGACLRTWRMNGRRCASGRIAQDRADTCEACDHNTRRAACASCQGLTAWVKQWLGRTVINNNMMYVCDITAVMNSAMVHMPNRVVRQLTPESLRTRHPATCWKVPIFGESDE